MQIPHKTRAAARPTQEARRRRRILILGGIITALGLGIPAAWENYKAALGPINLDVTARSSTVVLDRDDRLLLAFTTPDGRWRLPVAANDVDPRFLG